MALCHLLQSVLFWVICKYKGMSGSFQTPQSWLVWFHENSFGREVHRLQSPWAPPAIFVFTVFCCDDCPCSHPHITHNLFLPSEVELAGGGGGGGGGVGGRRGVGGVVEGLIKDQREKRWCDEQPRVDWKCGTLHACGTRLVQSWVRQTQPCLCSHW